MRQPPFTMEKVASYDKVMPYSLEPGSARRLWTLSEQLTGVPFAM